jgi:hypothetical protein
MIVGIKMKNFNINSNLKLMRSAEVSAINKRLENIIKSANEGRMGAAKILSSFTRYVRPSDITRLLVYYECFKKIKNTQGVIIDLGVLHGFSTFSMANFSEILEPRNYTRRIIGFDTFKGYDTDNFTEKDGISEHELDQFINFNDSYSSLKEMKDFANTFTDEQLLPQFSKIEFVAGNAVDTIPLWLEKNPGICVAMIIFGTDIYEPTKTALENFYDRMPKGALLLFGAINYNANPGETKAVVDTLGINNLQLERFDFSTKFSYAIKK